jgi:hypothetical protein
MKPFQDYHETGDPTKAGVGLAKIWCVVKQADIMCTKALLTCLADIALAHDAASAKSL